MCERFCCCVWKDYVLDFHHEPAMIFQGSRKEMVKKGEPPILVLLNTLCSGYH